jgi:hypothetical protein
MKKNKLISLSKIKKALYADWSLRVRARDGFKCRLCGTTENLSSHHWYVSDHHAHAARYAVDNGATLCYACHIRGIHQRADYVSVERVRQILKVNSLTMYGLDLLIKQELTTPLLRELWDAMRKRPIDVHDLVPHIHMRGDKVFLLKPGYQIAVVGNVLRIHNGIFCIGLQEVTTVAKTDTGYRYTLKKLEDGE